MLRSKVSRVDIETGEISLARELAPSDPTGVEGLTRVTMTPSGDAHAYSYAQRLNDLFVVEGLFQQAVRPVAPSPRAPLYWMAGHTIPEARRRFVIQATQIRAGMVILHNGKPCRVTSTLHVTPGNWRGMVHAKMVNIETGSQVEHRFRSEDKVNRADLDHHPLQYLYRSGEEYTFMNTETYEMTNLSADHLGDAVNYLVENMSVEVSYFNGKPVAVEVPMFVELEIVETDPVMKGATISASPKQATLNTGLVTKVPQHMGVGDRVKIDTRDGSFVERV